MYSAGWTLLIVGIVRIFVLLLIRWAVSDLWSRRHTYIDETSGISGYS